jgi:hypothetical protein
MMRGYFRLKGELFKAGRACLTRLQRSMTDAEVTKQTADKAEKVLRTADRLCIYVVEALLVAIYLGRLYAHSTYLSA